jgi:hypothetical protein
MSSASGPIHTSTVLQYLSSTASAGPSCPCPMEMSVRLPLSTVLPSLRAYSSMSLDGE